ncbi:SLATT domain-containing protein [Rheinheimera sp. FR7-31]|uniref:SLATT domain-containing protein n=1 Tax=Rheinheimera fenheensis TaxID=3152295 RepID=UPI00325E0BC0
MTIPDITETSLENWDKYKRQAPDDIIEAVYKKAENTSRKMCSWYWSSIRSKRNVSLAVRVIAFLLLALGTTLPIIAAIQETPSQKLWLTQVGVASLILAGLMQLADRVFGWSSGWMRYITTVTTMENLTRAFQMEWGKYLVAKTEPLEIADARTLFEIAHVFEQELMKLQSEETTKWVAEFNTSIALLDSMIKTQREETDKKLESIRTSLTLQESTTIAEKKAKTLGAIEVSLIFNGSVKPISICLDNNTPVDFLGNYWTQMDVSPGRHVVRIVRTSGQPLTIERIVDVKPDTLAKLEIQIGE